LAQKYVELAHDSSLKYRKVSALNSLQSLLPKNYKEGYSEFDLVYCPNTEELSCKETNWFLAPPLKYSGKLFCRNTRDIFIFSLNLIAKSEKEAKEKIKNLTNDYLKNHPKMRAAIEKQKIEKNS
jgi:hypothetical protein